MMLSLAAVSFRSITTFSDLIRVSGFASFSLIDPISDAFAALRLREASLQTQNWKQSLSENQNKRWDWDSSGKFRGWKKWNIPWSKIPIQDCSKIFQNPKTPT